MWWWIVSRRRSESHPVLQVPVLREHEVTAVMECILKHGLTDEQRSRWDDDATRERLIICVMDIIEKAHDVDEVKVAHDFLTRQFSEAIASWVITVACQRLEAMWRTEVAPDATEYAGSSQPPCQTARRSETAATSHPPRPTNVDRQAIIAERVKAVLLKFKRITLEDVIEMRERLECFVEAQDFAIMNEKLARISRTSRLSWHQLAFLACLHRRAIMSEDNGHAIEDGRHTGRSPVAWAGSFADEELEYLRVKHCNSDHASAAFVLLECYGFASKIRDHIFKGVNHPDNKAATYAAEPSDYWGFPPV